MEMKAMSAAAVMLKLTAAEARMCRVGKDEAGVDSTHEYCWP